MKPLVLDGYCGLGGWSEGFLAEGWDCVGIDIERHDYGTGGYPGRLILMDMLQVHGSEFSNVDCMVFSPPCQLFSYCSMPWSKAKQLAKDVRSDPARLEKELALFKACFRIQREACEAAGRHIPMVVENVRGAQPWVGRARWNYGSFYLWGDVPALMPITVREVSRLCDAYKTQGINWSDQTKRGQDFTRIAGEQAGLKTVGHMNKRNGHDHTRHLTNQNEHGVKQGGISGPRDNGKGDRWFQDGAARSGSKSNSRKAASAMIAQIPLPLAQWIARTYKPKSF